jgi:hypothetical protein
MTTEDKINAEAHHAVATKLGLAEMRATTAEIQVRHQAMIHAEQMQAAKARESVLVAKVAEVEAKLAAIAPPPEYPQG